MPANGATQPDYGAPAGWHAPGWPPPQAGQYPPQQAGQYPQAPHYPQGHGHPQPPPYGWAPQPGQYPPPYQTYPQPGQPVPQGGAPTPTPRDEQGHDDRPDPPASG